VERVALAEGESLVQVQDSLYYQTVSDKVFFLTLNDLQALLRERDQSRIDIYGYPTKETVAKNAVNQNWDVNTIWRYWLLSPDFESRSDVYTVQEYSNIILLGGAREGSFMAVDAKTDAVGVRPALYADPAALSLESGTGLYSSPYQAVGRTETVRTRATPGSAFSDVSPGAWYYDYVQEAYAKSLMKGKENNKFDPDGNLTVIETLIISLNLLGAQADAAKPEDNWYDPYVREAVKRGLIRTEDTFYEKLNEPVTRSEMAVIIVRAAGTFAEDAIVKDYAWASGAFGDVDTIPEPFRDSVYKAYASGILKGKDGGNFGGDQLFTRAEAATVACRANNRDFQRPEKP
jgi:hypothetical protein